MKHTASMIEITQNPFTKFIKSIMPSGITEKIKNNPKSQNNNGSYADTLNESNLGNLSDYSYQQSHHNQTNIGDNFEVQLSSITIDSAYNHKRSNFQKLKTGIKDTFSEEENYAFLVFIAVGVAGVSAYFVPGGLRKFVPSEELNIIDITVAIGATALIAIGVAVLAYSVHTNIVHSNVTNPTASSRNVQSLNS